MSKLIKVIVRWLMLNGGLAFGSFIINHQPSTINHHAFTPKPCRRAGLLAFLACILGVLACYSPAGAWPFADRMVKYAPGPGQWVADPDFNDPALALGSPIGGSVSEPDNTSVVTLGDGGSLTLGFNRPVWDDPRNPYGLDFIVFSNTTWVGGNKTYRWQELAFVEISADTNGNGLADDEWYLLLPSKLPSELIPAPAVNSDTGYSRTIMRQYAEYTPTLALPAGKLPEDFYTIPDRWSYSGDSASLLIDAGSGGGDAFDISTAVRESSPGVPASPLQYVHIPYFNFVRMTDALVGDMGDAEGVLGEVSAEIDAVSDVAPLPSTVTIATSKAGLDGALVSISAKVVSAVLPGEIYIQEEDRSSGIRVKTSDAVAEGDWVDVIGILQTENGERYIDKASAYMKTPGVSPKPYAMKAAQVGGTGLINTGLLVTAWGKVTNCADGFYISDGSRPAPGLKVVCSGLTKPTDGKFVVVTGVSSRAADGTVLKARKQSDILVAGGG